MNGSKGACKVSHLISAVLLTILPLVAGAEETAVQPTFKTYYRQADGSAAAFDATTQPAPWIRDEIGGLQEKLRGILPKLVATSAFEVELVSVPHPEISKPVNPSYFLLKVPPSAAGLIPIVSNVMTRTAHLYLGLEARITVPGKPTIVIPAFAQSEVEYRRGLGFSVAKAMEAARPVGREML